ncbi:MAG TPA: hypothetical protein VKB88_47085 [Bryobacteraceae bacterium]|nr:hypothetical protein [Bryobacteraceae bacterium]
MERTPHVKAAFGRASTKGFGIMATAKDERYVCKTGRRVLASLFLTAVLAIAQPGRDVLVLTSTNGSTNNVAVFKLDTSAAALSLVTILPTGGSGGSPGPGAGAVQFSGEFGAVTNYVSNTVSQLHRVGNSIGVNGQIALAANCVKPVSTAIAGHQLFVVGSTCAESHAWPSGLLDGSVVSLTDSSAAQIAAGQTWAAVTLTSGSVLQLPLNGYGALNGTSSDIALPDSANMVPLGEAFRGDLLGLNPAHSPDSFALINAQKQVFPVTGPQPAYPTNAPCWLAKGAGNIWYSGNSPGKAISIFFSDGKGGAFYKSVPLPGAPTDITVSADGAWLAVIYTAADGAHVAVFAIDAYGDLTLAATSPAVGVAAFDGVAFSQ